MKGQIIKILSNTHFVQSIEDNKIYDCVCRGIFRKNKVTPYVGDFVLFDNEQKIINEILPRKNEIKRPPVANIDQALVITSVKIPDFSTNLLDKLLVQLELNKITPVIILTKLDLIDDTEKSKLNTYFEYYKSIGYKVIENTKLDEIKELFKDKTTVFTGQTGAGKSKLLNSLDSNLNLETGEVSNALGRGRHTTRHIELYDLYGGKVLDTPGFSQLDFYEYSNEQIKKAFIEFNNFPCPYNDCTHTKENECNIKQAILDGDILSSRHETYLKIIQDIKSKRKW